jgi:hypothetical protein
VPDAYLHLPDVDHFLPELNPCGAVMLSEAKHLGLFPSGKWVQKLIRDSSPAIAGSE